MNAEQRQTAADPWTKPVDLSHWPACRQLRNHMHHRHLLLLGLKLILILPSRRRQKAESTWMAGYVPRWFTCPWAVTRPSSNRAQCRLTTLIEADVLTTTLHCRSSSGNGDCSHSWLLVTVMLIWILTAVAIIIATIIIAIFLVCLGHVTP